MLRNSTVLFLSFLCALYLSACQPLQAPPESDAAAATTDAQPAMEDHVIAEGFNGPQGILVDADGAVWVIEAGLGGEGELDFIAPGVGPVVGKFGESARVVQIAGDGAQTDAAFLPSVAAGQDVVGGARLALLDGTLYALVGQWYGDLGERPAKMAAVVAIGKDGVAEVGNTWDLENAQNPDPNVVDTHPYGLAAGPDGMLWIADAGGNDLLKADPATGETTLVAVFAGMPGPLPNPGRGGAMEVDPVPTGITFDADGTAYVSFLSGFPFIPGSAKVVTVDADGTVSDYATGLTMLTDLRTAPDGRMYAVQFGLFGEQGPTPNSGAIVRIGAGDASEIVADGLSFPTSIDFDGDGNAYVTINGVGAPGSGAVLMLPGLTGRAGTPLQ